MAITILKIALLLCVIIVPIRGPSKKREIAKKQHNEKLYSGYGINEQGELEELVLKENKKEDFL